jgi:hypothetical protein
MCLNGTYCEVWGGKHLSATFPIKNGLKEGNALLSLLVNFALEYASRKVQENQTLAENFLFAATFRLASYICSSPPSVTVLHPLFVYGFMAYRVSTGTTVVSVRKEITVMLRKILCWCIN